MLRIIKTGDTPKLQELSLKQREMLLAYRAEVAARKTYLDQKVTWREFIKETKDSSMKPYAGME